MICAEAGPCVVPGRPGSVGLTEDAMGRWQGGAHRPWSPAGAKYWPASWPSFGGSVRAVRLIAHRAADGLAICIPGFLKAAEGAPRSPPTVGGRGQAFCCSAQKPNRTRDPSSLARRVAPEAFAAP